MRVLLLTPSNRLLGARQSLLELVSHLPNEVEPVVVCPGPGALADALRERGVKVEFARQRAWRKLLGRIGAQAIQIPRLRAIASRFVPNLIHANEYQIAPQALRTSWRRVGFDGGAHTHRAPVVSHVRLGITPRQIANYDLEKCTRVVCVSNAVRDLFAGTPVLPRTRVVYNGVDVSRFCRDDHTRGALENVNWPDTALVAGIFGLVSERKNQLVAAEAVARAASRGADVRLLIAGDSFKSSEQYGEQLRARIAQQDLRERVVWLPFQSDIVPLYAACDVNMLISNEEGFGRTIIEAGAMGIASIGARVGGIPELIREGETGWTVPAGDVEAVAPILESAWRDRDDLARRGDAARRLVEEQFTIEACVKRTVEVWREAIDHP